MAGEEFVVPGAGADAGTAVVDPPADGEEVIEETPAGGEPGAGGGEGGEAGAGAGEGGGEGGDAAPDAELSAIETDGRKLEGKVRETAAKIAKIDKEAAKAFRENYYRTQAVMKEIPEAKTPGEAIQHIRNMRATIDSLGGEQGISDLQSEVSDYRKEIQDFANGSKELIEQLYDPENPVGLIRATRNSLDVLQAKNVAHFDEAILPHFAARLEKAGLGNAVEELLGFVKEGKGQEAYNLLGEVKKWLSSVKDKAANIDKAATAKNPEAEKLAKDKQDFEDQKQKDFQTRVETDVNRWNNPELDKVLGPLQKQLGLQKEGMSHFRNGVISRIWKVLANDSAYIKGVKAVRAKGDSVKTAEFIHRAFLERLPEQFRLHRNEIYPNIGAAKPKPAPAAAGNGKGKVTPINLQTGQRPRADQVDWTKTSDAMWATGRAYLLDGKFVQGFKDAPPNKY